MTSDTHFNGIAGKFDKNIYGTLKGKLRHALLTDLITERLKHSKNLRVLDLGCGTGIMAKECLALGHSVDVVDPSNEILNKAKVLLGSSEKAEFFCSSLQSYSSVEKYDLVICHAVLEWLANPLEQLTHIVSFLKPKGLLSLSAFNKDALRFGSMAYGNFDYVDRDMKAKKQVRLNPQNPIAPRELLSALNALNLNIESKAGIRCFHDYVKRPIDDSEFELLFKLEKQYAGVEPYLWLGKYFHVFATVN
ncbi:methyltransferase domain-containing protein [Alteromonas sp. 5E99-2]|uniref:methyltransferase domain-containing protein n=1 Tax=Alteromonas sp. 5E99-2 TaxID=2817683 RepID=UPI001A98FAFF|nr:methyltransferase domain-containing protein [Alteromonas sp. 5E99-2]MBO1255528.1 methyltransferase domain-containing protein [Alteromonas sp. 5E99-2]